MRDKGLEMKSILTAKNSKSAKKSPLSAIASATADFHYAPPPGTSSDKLVVLPLPIRIACGSDEAVSNFVPDPNMSLGQLNHNGSAVDVSIPNAAPEGVYQSKRYARDFAHTFAAAGGMDKAMVKDFARISPDANGNIVVRVTAAPGSLDQNAKISGIEILEESGG